MKRSTLPSPKGDEALPCVIAARVTDDEKAMFTRLADQLSTRESRLARTILTGACGQIQPPPYVPEINREAWRDLAGALGVLDEAVRALDVGRLADLDDVVLHAAIEASAAVDALRRAQFVMQRLAGVPPEVAETLVRMLDTARGVSAALHALRTRRVEELDWTRIEALAAAAKTTHDRLGEVLRLLLGDVSREDG